MDESKKVKNGGNSTISTISISMELVKATSLEVLRENGKARMLMPYWTFVTGGPVVFHFVHEKTDRQELEKLIEAGKVFIEEKYC